MVARRRAGRRAGFRSSASSRRPCR
jgi:hypothetical protein